ncbi:MAG TPA: septal ring lytic transglycosylase RlpA family protein [Gammaproteobacteria bacterium]
MRTCAALLLTVSLAACAGNPPQRSAPAPSEANGAPDVTSAVPPRSDRGNPPFYDVLGKRYHVLPTSAGYVQRGVASWYGQDFHGLATSSGERYDMHAMTAAHTTLPLPTWVEVTNLDNGKRVVVKVNDRGPFVKNRLIDLSFAAATALDMIGTGTTRVEVRAVAPPADAFRAPAPAAAAPPYPSASPSVQAASVERMFLQVGAFAQQENAERLVARLRASGFLNPTLVTQPDDGRRLHRVWLGPVSDSVEFDALDTRLRSIGVSNARLVTARAP